MISKWSHTTTKMNLYCICFNYTSSLFIFTLSISQTNYPYLYCRKTQMGGSLKEALMVKVSSAEEAPHAKVSVVGVGQVGMATAFSMVSQVGCTDHLAVFGQSAGQIIIFLLTRYRPHVINIFWTLTKWQISNYIQHFSLIYIIKSII